jgi:tRNA A37 threonylcarbamoyladenosine modification protein TsaB
MTLYRFDGNTLDQLMPEAAIAIRKENRISGKSFFRRSSPFGRKEIESQFGDDGLFAPLSAALPSAAVVAEICLASLGRGDLADIDGLTPLYVRRPEAEVAWEKRQQSQ